MTLDELLALLPDNDTGDIGADDLRTIVQELYIAAHTIFATYAFNWSTDQTPPTGKVSLNADWSTSSVLCHVSETTANGVNTPFGWADELASVQFTLGGQNGVRMTGNVSGVSVDQGTYRDVPVTISSATGTPANNQLLTLALVVVPSEGTL